MITKDEAIRLYDNAARLAEALGIGRSNISQWSDDKPIPEISYLKLRYELRPDAFTVHGKLIHSKLRKS